MAKTQVKPWQYKVTTTLTAVTLLLVLGYFAQSFIEIRKVKPVSVAVERIKAGSVESPENLENAVTSTEVNQNVDNVDKPNN